MSRRPEYFASFCLTHEGPVKGEIALIRDLSNSCAEQLSYWEILYVIGEGDRAAINEAAAELATIRNLRIILVNESASLYRRRAIAAAEAIGDIVTLGAFSELPHIDLIALAHEAVGQDQIIMARRTRGPMAPAFHWLLRLASDYRVDILDLKTIALPRMPLVRLLARPTVSIDLRFEPKRNFDRYLRKAVDIPSTASEGGLGHRIELVAEIVMSSAPRFLKAYAALSLLVCVMAGVYGVYAMGLLVLGADLQPGWFSTAITQSGSVAFLALGFAIFALGLAKIAERLDGGARTVILEEIGNISFFDRIHDLNVEMSSEVSRQ